MFAALVLPIIVDSCLVALYIFQGRYLFDEACWTGESPAL
jgi:hypothetical protein